MYRLAVMSSVSAAISCGINELDIVEHGSRVDRGRLRSVGMACVSAGFRHSGANIFETSPVRENDVIHFFSVGSACVSPLRHFFQPTSSHNSMAKHEKAY